MHAGGEYSGNRTHVLSRPSRYFTHIRCTTSPYRGPPLLHHHPPFSVSPYALQFDPHNHRLRREQTRVCVLCMHVAGAAWHFQLLSGVAHEECMGSRVLKMGTTTVVVFVDAGCCYRSLFLLLLQPSLLQSQLLSSLLLLLLRLFEEDERASLMPFISLSLCARASRCPRGLPSPSPRPLLRRRRRRSDTPACILGEGGIHRESERAREQFCSSGRRERGDRPTNQPPRILYLHHLLLLLYLVEPLQCC